MDKVLVWGLGRSGRSAVELLKSKGYKVFSGDDSRGDRWEEYIDEIDTVVLSPGIPPTHPLWKEALRRDLELVGELELASRFFEGDIIAITGTDGKSTTTRLVCLMLSSHFSEVWEGGNIGRPLSDIVLKGGKSLAVLEVSSFQGKTLKQFHPKVGSFLNFSTDHLDWHPDLKDYLLSKYRIFKNQLETDLFVAGSVQEEVILAPTKAKKLIPYRDFFVGKEVRFRNTLLFRAEELKLKGRHNLYNCAVASLIALHMGVPPEKIREVIRSFRGLPFRMELVMSYRGVEIYNDSKSTTPNSLKAALESFPDQSVVLIAGGKDKGADFSYLKDTFQKKVKYALLIGETRYTMKKVMGSSVPAKTFSSLEDAVREAIRVASTGDFILFSPGCSSFDMFSNYIERGEAFNRLVREHCKL